MSSGPGSSQPPNRRPLPRNRPQAPPKPPAPPEPDLGEDLGPSTFQPTPTVTNPARAGRRREQTEARGAAA